MAGSTAHELLRNALKRREELLEELEALNSLIETYQKQMRGRPVREDTPEDEPSLFKRSRRIDHAERIAEMIDAARKIILSEQRPMQRGQLRERLEALGFEIIGKDKNKVFGTNLWRSGKFRMIEGRGYWPMDEELPR